MSARDERMSPEDENNMLRVLDEMRNASLGIRNARMSMAVSICVNALSVELHDAMREPREVDLLDRNSDPVRLMRDFPAFRREEGSVP